jgi:hypothetical protein
MLLLDEPLSLDALARPSAGSVMALLLKLGTPS